MAQIITDKMAIEIETGTHVDPTKLFTALTNAFEWSSVSGTDAEKVFAVNSNVSLKFVNFNKEGGDNKRDINDIAKIYVCFGSDIEVEIYHLPYSYSSYTTYYNYPSPYDLDFKIIISASGDLIFKAPMSMQDAGSVYATGDVAFGIFAVQNTLHNEQAGYGVYVPYSSGGKNSSNVVEPFNHTPKYLITADTDTDLTNVGRAGSVASTTLAFVINDDAKITALANLCANCSECVTTNTFGMIIGNAYREGETSLNGDTYYCVGGIAMYEGS